MLPELTSKHRWLLIKAISFTAAFCVGLLISSSWCFSWAWPAQVLSWSKDGLRVNTTRFLSDLFGEQLEKISLPLPLRQNECCATSREGLSHLKCRAILWWLCDSGDYRVTAHYDTRLLSNIAFIGGSNILVCFIVIQQLRHWSDVLFGFLQVNV